MTASLDAGYAYRFNVQDHQGNNRMVMDAVGTVLQVNHYDPYGQLLTAISSTPAVSQYKYGGKEWSPTSLSYDFGARNYLPAVPRWNSMDPLAEKYYSISPYVYCAGNPVNRIDIQGRWDVTVHVYKDRSENGYGIAVVTNLKGEEVYRFRVRAQGVAGEDRMKTGGDTPLGIYDIPSSNPWIMGGSRESYGPNARLNMEGIGGEIEQSGRTNIRIHGGRQEYKSEGEWKQLSNPQLKKTQGCLRAFDSEIGIMKSITDVLTSKNPNDLPGRVIIVDDLEKINVPTSSSNMVEVSEKYFIPEELVITIEQIQKQYNMGL